MPASDDHDSEALDSVVPDDSKLGSVPDPDATADSVPLTADPDATADSAVRAVESQPQSDNEPNGESVDPEATFIPTPDVLNKVKEWEASISEDAEPGHTLKPPVSETDSSDNTIEKTVVLKRRIVSQRDTPGTLSDLETDADSDYQTEKLLGEGGMGAVYAARQQSMDRPVAIKVLKSRGARLESNRRAAAAHEKRTGADLVLDGSHGCAVFCCFRGLRDAVVEFGFEVTG